LIQVAVEEELKKMNPSMHWIGIFFAVDVINNNGIL
jgi:hypothetical protein